MLQNCNKSLSFCNCFKKMKINREELVIGYIATLVAGVLFALGPIGNDQTKEMALFFFKLSFILFVIFRVTKEE